jgi:hypothetical protein
MFRSSDVLEVVNPQVPQRRSSRETSPCELGGDRREHDLSAVTGRGFSRSSVDINADVATVVHPRRPRVYADPDAQALAGRPGVCVQLSLRLCRSGDRFVGAPNTTRKLSPSVPNSVPSCADHARRMIRR